MSNTTAAELAAKKLRDSIAAAEPTTSPFKDSAAPFYGVDEIRRDYERRGQGGRHWFEPGAMRFFKSRLGAVLANVDGATLFLTTEQGPHMPRRASIRAYIHKSAEITTVGDFNAYSSAQARRLAKEVAAAL